MREWITTTGEIAGTATFTYGCWSYSHPLGLVVGGAAVALFSWLVAR